MDCNTLPPVEHKVLAYLSERASRRRMVVIGEDFWDDCDEPRGLARAALTGLIGDGWVKRRSETHLQIVEPCNCGSRTPEQDVIDRLQSDTRIAYEGSTDVSVSDMEEAYDGTSDAHASLRSRDDVNRTTSTTGSSAVGQRVSRRRIATTVARNEGCNKTLIWQQRPVENWNATHFAGYFDFMSFEHLRKRSTDRFRLKPMLGYFAQLRREEISNEDIKSMIDLFVREQSTKPGRVDSLWRRFIQQRGRLYKALTTNAGRQYNNQPQSSPGDERKWV